MFKVKRSRGSFMEEYNKYLIKKNVNLSTLQSLCKDFNCIKVKSRSDKTKLFVHKKILKFSSNYTDILKISRQIFDLNIVKFIIFNKKQLAMFNSLQKKFLPFSEYNDKLSKLINFEKNVYEVEQKAEDFIEEIAFTNKFNNDIDRKLAKFYFNLIN